ncbi:MAG: outer membrane lipoprotein LolB [Burkholderiaceae bacterium]|jgi:outer membrane biogenesis lipoprotein LolB|nr:outer membrane lipoprotein LolB [Burkholderiales bacterium]MCZ8106566.1 outer membrane lipoprotein LolB [Burkholderiales bacterium]MCZ8338463.1 outer membrane lipoprotein LolB [Burkholderiaceae bacterium]
MWRSERRARRPLGSAVVPAAVPAAVPSAAAAVALCAALAGCAVAPPEPVPPPAPATEAVRQWAGRFSVVQQSAVPGANQDTGTGRFVIVSRPTPTGRALDLEVASPFGQTIATGRRAPDGASTLTLSDGRRLEAPSLDALLERALGLSLPIERLPAWLDDRFETVLERDAQGRPSLAQDSGWQIEREPRRWAMQRPQGGGTLRVVLVLDR